MRKLIAPTEDFIKGDSTTLAADVSKGTNVSFLVENNNGIADNYFVVVGKEGSEKAELQQINAVVVAGQTIQVATLLFDHKAGEPVRVFQYNARKFYGSLTKTGSYTELTADGSPVTIQVDDPQGTLLEYTGVQGYEYFKATYYNTETAAETSADDAEPALADESVRYASLYGIRKMAGFTENPYITDGRIEAKRTQAENEINSILIQRYALPLAEIPAIITYVCELLGAGYMHYEEFGNDTDGVKKLGEARAILKGFQDGTRRLIGADMIELDGGGSTNEIRGYPTSNSGRKFTMDQRF